MVELPDNFHFLPALVGRLGHVILDVRLFHLLERMEDAEGGLVELEFVDRSHAHIVPDYHRVSEASFANRPLYAAE